MDSESLRIQEVLEADRPRERLAALGAQTLTNTDLVALLLEGDAPASDAGTEAAADLTRRLLTRFRSLRTLARCDPRELVAVEGLTQDKALLLAAAFELGRRVSRETIAKMRVDSPEIVCQLLAQDLRALNRESLRALLLDTKFQLIRIEEISLGSLNESVAHPREIYRPALIHSAYAIIMVHNHPSGDPTPSKADKLLDPQARRGRRDPPDRPGGPHHHRRHAGREAVVLQLQGGGGDSLKRDAGWEMRDAG